MGAQSGVIYFQTASSTGPGTVTLAPNFGRTVGGIDNAPPLRRMKDSLDWIIRKGKHSPHPRRSSDPSTTGNGAQPVAVKDVQLAINR